MDNDNAVCRAIDDEHLKLLSIFYYILGALGALWALVPLIYVLVGLVLVVLPFSIPAEKDAVPLAFFGVFFMLMGLFAFVISAVIAALKLYTGHCLSRRKNRTFCFVVAAVCCLGFPLGTILGVFTFIVLSRPSVAEQFNAVTAEVM